VDAPRHPRAGIVRHRLSLQVCVGDLPDHVHEGVELLAAQPAFLGTIVSTECSGARLVPLRKVQVDSIQNCPASR
jgi:hypothetical protein